MGYLYFTVPFNLGPHHTTHEPRVATVGPHQNILPGGTSGGAGNDAGLPLFGSDIPLPGTKPEVAGSRNFGYYFLQIPSSSV